MMCDYDCVRKSDSKSLVLWRLTAEPFDLAMILNFCHYGRHHPHELPPPQLIPWTPHMCSKENQVNKTAKVYHLHFVEGWPQIILNHFIWDRSDFWPRSKTAHSHSLCFCSTSSRSPKHLTNKLPSTTAACISLCCPLLGDSDHNVLADQCMFQNWLM